MRSIGNKMLFGEFWEIIDTMIIAENINYYLVKKISAFVNILNLSILEYNYK